VLIIMDKADKSTEYTIHEHSPAEGDIVLVGTDNIGVRVESFYLKAHRYG
jgi:hypothetical protein